ncbi:MAG TPA: FAD:protein FMN transferase [Gemmatimonadales bacterium]|nr:FAD:protein FMN transferase [Gemmatimonadales bacterium]
MTADLNRRQLLTLGVGLFVTLSIPPGLRRRTLLARRTLPLMGTLAELQVAHFDQRLAEDAIDAALAELLWVERTMTRFRPDSDIGRANLGAAREAVTVTPATAAVIGAALRWAEATDGRFDPALGAASELWDVLHRRVPPPAEPVRRLAGRGFWRTVDLDRSRGMPAVRFGDPEVRLDLGGIAKGYGVDRATAALRARGIEHAIVTVGGDLYALGTAPGGHPWQVGIRSPHHPSALAATLELSERAVATSGDYERFFRWRGVRYHHLIDPDTAAPRRTPVHSTTVLADRCLDADAAATAVFGMPREEAERTARRLAPGADVIPLT